MPSASFGRAEGGVDVAPRWFSFENRDTWAKSLTFTEPAAEVVFHDYRRQVEAAVERVRRLERELAHHAQNSPHLPLIAALQSMRGIALVTAVTAAYSWPGVRPTRTQTG